MSKPDFRFKLSCGAEVVLVPYDHKPDPEARGVNIHIHDNDSDTLFGSTDRDIDDDSYDHELDHVSITVQHRNVRKVIEGLQATPFFNTMRSATLGALYGNETVARDFGFEGSSVEHGGFVNRGFDDLGWLPELPDNA